MKKSDWAMVAAIVLMLGFITVKNSEHKTETFINIAASVQNTIDK